MISFRLFWTGSVFEMSLPMIQWIILCIYYFKANPLCGVC